MHRIPTNQAMAALNRLEGDWTVQRTATGSRFAGVKYDDRGEVVGLTMLQRSASAAIQALYYKFAAQLGV